MTEEEFNTDTTRILKIISDLVYAQIMDDHVHPAIVCRAMAQVSGVVIHTCVKDTDQRAKVIAALIQTLCYEAEQACSVVRDQSNEGIAP